MFFLFTSVKYCLSSSNRLIYTHFAATSVSVSFQQKHFNCITSQFENEFAAFNQEITSRQLNAPSELKCLMRFLSSV